MSKIVKGHGVAPSSGSSDHLLDSGGVIHKRVMDARSKADQIVKDALKQSAEIKTQAESVLADGKKRAEEAVKKGYADGQSKGLAAVTEKLLMLEALKEKFYAEAEPDVVKLAMMIAEKIIGDLAVQNAELVKAVAKQALEKTLGDRIVIRFNPEDYKLLIEEGSDFRQYVDKTKRLTIRPDDGISKGGCIVESEVGTIDAQLEPQLSAIRKALC